MALNLFSISIWCAAEAGVKPRMDWAEAGSETTIASATHTRCGQKSPRFRRPMLELSCERIWITAATPSRLLCLVNLRQQVRLRFIAHQMRITLASVIVDLVGFEVVGVFDQQVQRSGSTFTRLQSCAQNIGRVLAAVHGNELHSRSNAGKRGGHSFGSVNNSAVVA